VQPLSSSDKITAENGCATAENGCATAKNGRGEEGGRTSRWRRSMSSKLAGSSYLAERGSAKGGWGVHP
jgi:hypothetical protein